MINEKIEDLLPQRPPFLFADKVSDFHPGKFSETELFLRPDFGFFKGHFPNNPVMPGVLICEAMAQCCGTFIALSEKLEGKSENELYYLASSNVKFLSVVRAGETLKIRASLVKMFQGLAQFSVEAASNGRAAAKGTIVLASSKNAK
ncbi:MAG: beta-hydroxyacyl-ACP dehydratase [Opitutales bacterium]|nr:beta-hydroxyacyl-ACP dehydratase [Opitutales bacterium]